MNSRSPIRFKSTIQHKQNITPAKGRSKIDFNDNQIKTKSKQSKVKNTDDNIDIIRDDSPDNYAKMRQSLRFFRQNKPILEKPEKVEPMPKIQYQKQFNDKVENVILTINKNLKEIDLQEKKYNDDFIKDIYINSDSESENIEMNNSNNFKISNTKGKDLNKFENKDTSKYKIRLQNNTNHTNKLNEK